MSGEELERIVDEHMNLSQALGFSVGIHGKSDDDQAHRQPSIVDPSDTVTLGANSIKEGLVPSRNKEVLLSFLRVSPINLTQ